ncbi:MAG: membrane protein insertase YidC [Spirochaetaceae bacterium]|nr:membrane protein insertase YidC [Spirochaetaceae bacterium]
MRWRFFTGSEVFLDFLYNIIIYPIVQIIEFVFVFTQKVFYETGFSVIAVSLAVSVLCLPLYNVAEKWQKIERDVQKKLKPKIDKIKAVFKGDEQYMILSTYYRQNNYHPVYALRNTFSLLIQIPFFIAAYSYLSHLDALKGVDFLFIADMGAPDAVIKMNGASVNLLPILMTVINLASAAVYTKGFAFKEKAQLYVMAALFLILLYNSPAGLVLYWTCNNIFSLFKNCVSKLNIPKYILRYMVAAIMFLLNGYILFFHNGSLSKRLIVICIISFFLLLILFINPLKKFFNKHVSKLILPGGVLEKKRTFIGSALILFLLSGLAAPSALISSSVAEFMFIPPYSSPLPFIGATMLKSAGFFLVWCAAVYFFFSKKVKIAITLVFLFLTPAALICVFAFPGNYGFITTTLIFSDVKNPSAALHILNMAAVLAAAALYIYIAASKLKIIFYSMQTIIIITLAAFGVGNVIKIQTEFSQTAALNNEEANVAENRIKPVYRLSKNGKNVIVIMLDRGISGYVPYIFEEKPELRESFAGFTYYPNCVSLGGYTLLGLPALFGGYEYAPNGMQEQSGRSLLEKYNEAMLVLPRLFTENGFSVTVTDPTYAGFSSSPDLSIYNEYPGIHAENLHGMFLPYWQEKHSSLELISISDLLKYNLIRFSFFKMSPTLLRIFIYDKGNWLSTKDFTEGNNEITRDTLDNYSMLEMLNEITVVDDSEKDVYVALTNDLTHEPAFLQPPDYIPSNVITNKGPSPFADEDHYHVNMASLIMLGKWFDYMKALGIYDNTRIIIASDHGWYHNTKLPYNFTLPNGSSLVMFNSLLMVKDFSSGEPDEIKTDYTFMTQADVPYLASVGLSDAVNPFTKASLFNDKKDWMTVCTAHEWKSPDRRVRIWNIDSNEWLRVCNNIFDPKNWEAVKK